MTEELITWLKAQLDEDEGLARHAFGDHNHAKAEWTEIWSGTVDTGGGGEEHIACFDAGFSRHIVNFDPARVLREVEAKREIIRKWEVDHGNGYPNYEGGYESALEDVIYVLAAVYSDRPGYQESWKL